MGQYLIGSIFQVQRFVEHATTPASKCFSLADIAEFLEARDSNQLLCHGVLNSIEQRLLEVDRRLSDLLALRKTLTNILDEAQNLPLDSECNEQCTLIY